MLFLTLNQEPNMRAFKYSRKKTITKKDETGASIPLKQTNAEGVEEVVAGKFETEVKWVIDYINLDLFIRTHAMEDGTVIVLLNDGHEVTDKVPVLRNKNKPATPTNITEEKIRQWVQSEILISNPDEVQDLYRTLDSLR